MRLNEAKDVELQVVKKYLEGQRVNPLEDGFIVAGTSDEIHVWEMEVEELGDGPGPMGSLDIQPKYRWKASHSEIERELVRRDL